MKETGLQNSCFVRQMSAASSFYGTVLHLTCLEIIWCRVQRVQELFLSGVELSRRDSSSAYPCSRCRCGSCASIISAASYKRGPATSAQGHVSGTGRPSLRILCTACTSSVRPNPSYRLAVDTSMSSIMFSSTLDSTVAEPALASIFTVPLKHLLVEVLFA